MNRYVRRAIETRGVSNIQKKRAISERGFDLGEPAPLQLDFDPEWHLLEDRDARAPEHFVLDRKNSVDIMPNRALLERYSKALEPSHLVAACRALPTDYQQEALLQSFLRLRPRDRDGRPWDVRGQDVGISPSGRLGLLRSRVQNRVEAAGMASLADQYILWGAPAQTGRFLAAAVGRIARNDAVHDDLTRIGLGKAPISEVLEDWLLASGVRHPRTLEAMRGLARRASDMRRPSVIDLPISEADFNFALQLTGPDARLCLAFGRCLMRVLAYTQHGYCVWRSTWIRGQRTHEDAIPGASTQATKLDAMLKAHILELSRGWSAGKYAATYRVIRQLRSGPFDAARMALELGLELDEEGRAKRQGDHRRRLGP